MTSLGGGRQPGGCGEVVACSGKAGKSMRTARLRGALSCSVRAPPEALAVRAELLANFLKMLQQTMSETSAYGSNSQMKSVTAALIVDFQS